MTSIDYLKLMEAVSIRLTLTARHAQGRMYRSAFRQPPWTVTGYVCRSCRHHLTAAQQQQSRHVSTSTTTAEHFDDADAFNSLSEEFGDRPRPASKRGSGFAAKIKLQRAQHRERRARTIGVESLGAGNTGTESTGQTESLPRRADDQAVAGQANTAFTRNESPSEPRAGMNYAARRQAARAKSAVVQERRRLYQEMAIRNEKSGRDEAKTTPRVNERHAPGSILTDLDGLQESGSTGEQTTGNAGQKERENAGRPNGVRPVASRENFEDIMAKLARDMTQSPPESNATATLTQARKSHTEVADDVDVPAGLVSGKQSTPSMLAPESTPQRINTPHFSHSSASDAVNLPAGLVSDKLKKSSNASLTETSDQSDYGQPEDTLLYSASRPASVRMKCHRSDPHIPIETKHGKTYRFQQRKPLSLAEKVQEAKDRPQWGGSFSGAEVAKAPGRISFESLRATDKVSKERVVSTAGERKAWGVESSDAKSIKPTQDTALEQTESSRAEENKPTMTFRPVSGAPPVSRSSAFDTLKQKLGLRGGKLSAEEARAMHDARNKTIKASDAVLASPREVEVDHKVEDETAPDDDARERLTKLHEGITAVPGATTTPVDATDPGVLAQIEKEGDSSGMTHHSMRLLSKSQQKSKRRLRVKAMKRVAQKPEIAGEQASPVQEEHRSLSEVMGSHDVDPVSEPTAESRPETDEPEVHMPEVLPSDIKSISASDLRITALNVEQPPVPPLQYGLDRVLFNPGVYQLQDPRSRVYNFDPYLQKIMPVSDFDFNALKEYKTSSEDSALSDLAKQHAKKYVGSTSSMTGTLGHFHYLLSNFRDLNMNMLSRTFPQSPSKFTNINKAPNAIFLRWKNGTYAIDADKEFDSPNVLMMLGKSMEKLLTLPREEFERYRKGSSNAITPDEKTEPESYEYTAMGGFLMRSQLDAYDKRLPGTGMFDLKTRAVVSIRMDAGAYESMQGYEIHTLQGNFESYEREYYDMMRSTMLKYMLQARMGRMDGIFVAYHNVQRIFGFQYISIAEMDRAIHGQVDPCLGDQEFRTSLQLLNEVMDMATQQFPETSLRMHFEASEKPSTLMWVFAEPMTEPEIEGIQSTSKKQVEEYERRIMGMENDEAKQDIDETAEVTSIESSTQPSNVTDDASQGETSTSPDSSEETATPSQSPPVSAEHTSYTSAADNSFIDQIATQPAEEFKPLFAATIICQNFVNGQPVDNNHVTNLKRGDKWEVQYILKEAQMTLAAKWAQYEDVKTRRRVTFERAQGEPGEDGLVEVKKESYYIQNLREMAARGREFREKIDEMEAGFEAIVLDSPLSKAYVTGKAEETAPSMPEKSSGLQDREPGASVDDYMRWLYSHQSSS